MTSPPQSHLPSKLVHADKKQRIRELKAARVEFEEKTLEEIVEALERSIWKKYKDIDK